MENNKYYTPEIEEFRVGFEYEFRHPDYKEKGWVKYDTPEFNWEREDSVPTFSRYQKVEDFRVKYLDAQDIEELGFKQEYVINGTTDELEPGHILHKTENLFYVINSLENNKYLIYKGFMYNEYSGNWDQEDLYQGTILNKSELKWILTRIGVL